jgi:beta-glucuronidase
MDYCDQSGLVVLSEIPTWQYEPDQLAQEVIQNKIKQQYFEMIQRDMNRPSIMSWSLGNEWRNFQKSFASIKSLVDYARGADTTHFITFVTGSADIDRSNDLVDIICTNWAQYQWYDPITYLDQAEGRKNIAKLEEIRQRFPSKPVILTEFGGAESQAGWHNWGNVKWSEEYQARNVYDSGKYALEQDWMSGGCVWQFCDTRTDPSRMLAGRLHGWNAKGVVDAYRLPKMAYYKLQELFIQFDKRREP